MIMIVKNSQIEVWLTECAITNYYNELITDIYNTYAYYFDDLDSDDWPSIMVRANKVFMNVVGVDIYTAIGECYGLSDVSIKQKIKTQGKRNRAWGKYINWLHDNCLKNDKIGKWYASGYSTDKKIFTAEEARLIYQQQYIQQLHHRNPMIFDGRVKDRFYEMVGLRRIALRSENEMNDIRKHMMTKADKVNKNLPYEDRAVAKWYYITRPFKLIDWRGVDDETYAKMSKAFPRM